MLEDLLLAVRDFFPVAGIAYVVSRSSDLFLEGHSDGSHLWPVYQDASSVAFLSQAPCRNITGLNTLHTTCRMLRRFDGCSPLSVAGAVRARLGEIESVGTSHPRCFPA